MGTNWECVVVKGERVFNVYGYTVDLFCGLKVHTHACIRTLHS